MTESAIPIDVSTAPALPDGPAARDAFKHAFLDNLFYTQGKFPALATQNDYYQALACAVRDHLLQRWISTAAAYTRKGSRTVAYLSAEFLMGPHLCNNLINLGMYDEVREAIGELGLDFGALQQLEQEPGLGNGGLGRLAACFIDSLATLEIPSVGYGIRYEFGIFHQDIVDGWQQERTDNWLRFGNPWEIVRPEWAVDVKLRGYTEQYRDELSRLRVRWVPHKEIVGVPYDTPILGYRNNTANTLRLWKSEASESFDFSVFNRGDYYGAVNRKVASENLSKVLYPNDDQLQGKELRLEQQYFFVSCSLQDMFRILRTQKLPVERFHEKFAIQLNDTHPAIAVAELMRLLIDEHVMPWDEAWSITTRTFAYTNHTLLPEALECWPLDLFRRVLPRHLEIIFEINARFLDDVRIQFLGDEERLARMSLIDERGERYVRMAHLACVGSHAINGVAAMHSELLKSDLLRDFHALWPEKFQNKTNGVTPRRWMVLANPRLSRLVTAAIGDGWITDLHELKKLEPMADDRAFCSQWDAIKQLNKQDFAQLALERTGVVVDPQSMFDVQVKRIHEYKRQHLNILHVIALYLRLKAAPNQQFQPRTFVFGGKAAPGYHMAKLIIKLINSVGEVINRDAGIRDQLKVVFLPNFNVSNGQRIYPAADLSEQISTAGKEASGTGNMKFTMNGALTIGTLDGANVEIRDQVGADNFFLFGLEAEGVAKLWQRGYGLFRPLLDNLMHHDPYMVLADFPLYRDCQQQVGAAYADRDRWVRMSILNSARSGLFSSDRSIRDYSRDIWRVASVPVRLLTEDEVKVGFLQ
jgi:glycogen phosphorylase